MYGLSYAKSIKLDDVKQMLVAIVDAEDLIETGRSCSQQAKKYAIGFDTIAKRAKTASGLYM